LEESFQGQRQPYLPFKLIKIQPAKIKYRKQPSNLAFSDMRLTKVGKTKSIHTHEAPAVDASRRASIKTNNESLDDVS